MRMTQGRLMARRIVRHGGTPNFPGFRSGKKKVLAAGAPETKSDAERASEGVVVDKAPKPE